jgi:hypothetical protein
MAKIIVGGAMLVAGIALMIYCGPTDAAAMTALYGAIASTGFSMALGGIAQELQGQHSPPQDVPSPSLMTRAGRHRLYRTVPVRRPACPRGCVDGLAQVIARATPAPKN